MSISSESQEKLSRRTVLGGLAFALTGSLASASVTVPGLPRPPSDATPAELASNESFWRELARYYDRTEGVVNLEHGFWGKMARPVQTAYIEATQMVNAQSSFYARKDYAEDFGVAHARVADALGAHPDEIVLTRNATESIQNLVRQYRGLKAGDAVLYADIDYPSFKRLMRSLEESHGVRSVEVRLPSRATQAQILEAYRRAFDANPALKLMLITHVSNQHGLVVPVAAIAAEARRRGIDVICDSAQSWGLVDYRVTDLGVDWAAFNLHKWIGAPLGIGALYTRRGSLAKIAPYPGEQDAENVNAAARVHSGTGNFASILAIPSALDFHAAIGGANKEARLRYLRSLWTSEAANMEHIELLGGADESSWTGIGSFRLRGKNGDDEARALQLRLETEFGIFTVARFGLADGACIRLTPQVFTSSEEIGKLTQALARLKT